MPEGRKKNCTLPLGTVVRQQWMVKGVLGQGGFGVVYMVSSIVDKGAECLAMKVEMLSRNRSRLLTMEATVMKRAQHAKHVLPLIATGFYKNLCYLVMPMHRWSLADVRKRMPDGRFSLSTVCRLAIQCFEASREVHSIGFVHRDIKPSNMLLDLQANQVYLIDFGLARRHLKSDGTVRPERRRASFRGTRYYASINVHQLHDYGRRDDLWSIMYSVMEFLNGTLPWRSASNQDIPVMKMQQRSWEIMRNYPFAFMGIYAHLGLLRYEDEPHYAYYIDLVRCQMKTYDYCMDDPYDWELSPLD